MHSPEEKTVKKTAPSHLLDRLTGLPRKGEDFGVEGSNKTIPVPKPEGGPPEELGIASYIKKSPYTRG